MPVRGKLNIRKTLLLLVALNILQTLGVVIVTVRGGLYPLPVLVIISLAGTLVSLLLVHPILFLRVRLRQAEESIVNLNGLNMTLRAQRHDFLNHLQVVYSLLETEDFAEAKAYIEKEYDSVVKVSSIMRTRIPAVNAILQAKRVMCENRGITVSIDVRSDLSELPLPAWEFCRVLGNLIDNAIHALVELDREKMISIELYEDLSQYRLRIQNNGPAIPEALLDKIFEAGFSTRENGDGMGLAICRRILASHGGCLTVESKPEQTVFEGGLPRKALKGAALPGEENDSWSV
jgi:sensor histidine kinase regulating citrate/malate metabolism